MPRPLDLERQCALTREVKPIADLIRFAVSPDGEVVPDTDAKADGRGVWISLGHDAVAEAVKKKAFAKSLKSEVKVDADLAGLTHRRLAERLLSSLSMARKAGQILTGASKVKAAIETGEAIALITASDAAADGRGKLLLSVRGAGNAARDAGLDTPDMPHLEMLDSGQLGLALGMENVIHAALTKGAAAQAVLQRAHRLARYDAN